MDSTPITLMVVTAAAAALVFLPQLISRCCCCLLPPLFRDLEHVGQQSVRDVEGCKVRARHVCGTVFGRGGHDRGPTSADDDDDDEGEDEGVDDDDDDDEKR